MLLSNRLQKFEISVCTQLQNHFMRPLRMYTWKLKENKLGRVSWVEWAGSSELANGLLFIMFQPINLYFVDIHHLKRNQNNYSLSHLRSTQFPSKLNPYRILANHSFVIPLGSSWRKGRQQCFAIELCLLPPSLLRSSWCQLSLTPPQLIFFQILAGLPIFLLPCGFHFEACLIVSVPGFLSRWPILLAISVCMCCYPVLLRSSLLLIFTGQWILRIFLRHLLTKLWSLFISEYCPRIRLK